MRKRMCEEFQMWLERLPRKDLSPAFHKHLETCPECRRDYQDLLPVIEALASAETPSGLSEKTIEVIAERACQTATLKERRLLALKLSAVGLFCLPLILLINGGWAFLGYRLLVDHVSNLAATIFLGIFIILSSFISSLMYGSIPLLVAWMRRHNHKEVAS